MRRIKSGRQFTTGWSRELSPFDIAILEEEMEKGTVEFVFQRDQEWVGGESIELVWKRSHFMVKPDAPDPHEEI